MEDQLLNMLENERRYVARELHDGVAQTTLQLGLLAGICRKLLEQGNSEMLADQLAELQERIELASTQVRQLIADMRPPRLEPTANLDDYIQQAIDTHLQRGGPAVDYQAQLSDVSLPLSAEQMLTLFRIIQEAFLNVRKHAEAEQVRLTVTDDENYFYITIADDGQGFDPAEVQARPADKGGAGLANMQARAQAIEATLTIERDSTGAWTEVTITLAKGPERPPNVLLSTRLP